MEDKTRQFIENVHFILRTGAQCRELPSYDGKWRSAHKRYDMAQKRDLEWATPWFFRQIDGASVMIDATIVRASSLFCWAWSRAAVKADLQQKIHAVVDASG